MMNIVHRMSMEFESKFLDSGVNSMPMQARTAKAKTQKTHSSLS